jgi:hypothetical protein
MPADSVSTPPHSGASPVALSEDMRRVVLEQRLGFAAEVFP